MCGGQVINHKKKKNMKILLSVNKHVENDILDIYLYHTVHTFMIYLYYLTATVKLYHALLLY